MKIGVFDSGIGGLSVAQAIQKHLPELEVIYRNDSKHVPYGNRTSAEILGFVMPIFQDMINEGCKVIVVACNTVTTTLIDQLRERLNVPLVGVEPMVKPAAIMSKSKIIAVCATPTTLASSRYAQLKELYAKGVQVIQPDCSDWSEMIEAGNANRSIIESRINTVIESGADVIVLACTHYHWIEKDIKQISLGKAVVIQPEDAIVNRLARVIERL